MNKKDFEEYPNGMFSVSDTLRKTEHCWAGNDNNLYWFYAVLVTALYLINLLTINTLHNE